MEKFLKFLDRVVAACDRYNNWYQRSKWGDYNVPSCPLCNNKRENLILGAPRLQSYRYQNARITMLVACPRCNGRMTASCGYGSKKWTYFIN
jgi:hypothetical protein